MSIGPSRTPARDAGARVGAFEVEIEEAWYRLQALGPRCIRVACLSPATGLIALRPAGRGQYAGEIGTYSRDVELADFRADCFWMLENRRGRQ